MQYIIHKKCEPLLVIPNMGGSAIPEIIRMKSQLTPAGIYVSCHSW